MTIEIKKQKLHEYLESATPEVIEGLYEDYLDESGPTNHSNEFWIEIEQRRQDYLSGKEKTVSAEEAMNFALNPSHRK